MRVMHWYPKFQGGGGVANAVLGLASAQAHLGAEVAIAAVHAGALAYAPMELKTRVSLMLWRPYPLPLRLVRFGPTRESTAPMCAFEPDVVHVHGEFNPDNLCVASLFKCPLVLSPHGGFHPEVFRRGWRLLKRTYFSYAKRRLYRHTAMHAVSPLERETLSRLFPRQRIFCVHQGPGVHANRFAENAQTRRRDRNDVIRFIFVGRLYLAEKGLDILLDAFAEAAHRLPDRRLELRLVGPDWKDSLSALRERARTLGILDRVEFTGARAGPDVASLLADSDIYVQLSRNDGFGLSVAEALLMGLPAVLSDAIGAMSFPELRSLPHVRVVPPQATAAAAAMVDCAMRVLELSEQAAQHLDALRGFLSWETAARLQLDHYRECQGTRPGPALTSSSVSAVYDPVS